MAKLLKLRRGTTSQHSSFTGAEGEVTVDTTKDVLVVHDGSTAGGHAMAAQDMDNVPAGSILGTQLENSGVTAGQYGTSSAIPVVTVDAQGLVTSVSTVAPASQTQQNFTNADHSKLDGIEAGATADQTSTEIKALLASDNLGSSHIGDDAIGASELADNAVLTARIADSNVTTAKLATDAVTSAKLANNAVYTAAIQSNAVTNAKIANDSVDVTKMLNFPTGTLLGRSSSGTGNATTLNASEVRSLLNVENGATADQSASEILTAIKTVDGTGSGLDADSVDGISGQDLLRSDTADTAAGDITFTGGAGAVTIGAGSDLRFSTNSTGWTGDHAGKIQHHGSILYIQGGTNGSHCIILRDPDGTNRVMLDPDGHWVPMVNNTYDLGSTTYRWRNLYTNDLNLSNEGSSNDVDGTWGDWTIQEGESDLFLKNNRSGKKYKFNLTEVS